jgi:hypothetical protein
MAKQYKNRHTGWAATQMTDKKERYDITDKDGKQLGTRHLIDIEGNPLIWEPVTEKQETPSLKLSDLKGKKVIIICESQSDFDKIWQIMGWTSRPIEYKSASNCIEIGDTPNSQSCNWHSGIDWSKIPAAGFIAANTSDWEIVEFECVDDKRLFVLGEDKTYSLNNNKIARYSLDNMLNDGDCVKNGDYSIHAIRHNGHVYRVGDKLQHIDGQTRVIEKFAIYGDYVNIWMDKTTTPNTHFTPNFEKCWKPYTETAFLLVTEDGVNITNPEQIVFCLHKSTHEQAGVARAIIQINHTELELCFSTAEARTAYVNNHAKTMSVADLEAWDMPSEGVYKHSEFYFIPKSKVNGQQS